MDETAAQKHCMKSINLYLTYQAVISKEKCLEESHYHKMLETMFKKLSNLITAFSQSILISEETCRTSLLLVSLEPAYAISIILFLNITP